MNSKFRAIVKRIKEHDTIVIARHIGPDPDAVASQIALRDAIKLRYPSKNVYAVGTPVTKFKSYGKLDKVDEEKLENALLFVLDCPNISRIDGANIEKYSEVIKIDHHPFEDKMGEIEWIDEKSSSTSEMITELLIGARFRANKSIAENLFLGVVSDSDRFLFGTTSPKTLELMAILIKNSKIDIASIYPRLYMRPLNEVKFQAYITEHLKVTSNKFASLKIDKKIIDKYDVDAGTASNLVNNFNNIEEILCWALVSYDEKQKIYKVNIRSRGPVINEVASKYNGGGHAMASGARISSMKEVDDLLKALDESCKEYLKEIRTLKDAEEKIVVNKIDENIIEEKSETKDKNEKVDTKNVVEDKSKNVERKNTTSKTSSTKKTPANKSTKKTQTSKKNNASKKGKTK